MNHVPLDISAAKAKAASGVKPLGPQADDPGFLEQEAASRARQEQTARLRVARLAREADARTKDLVRDC
jgi:hypothetical protein